MKKLILSAVNDAHDFWFDNLIPFLASLQNTNYDGDIGIISYGLSDKKIEILSKNGIIVFNAPYKYNAIYLDRQWAAADIAERYGYDQIALYDADIWFPSKNFTVFSQIHNQDSLYCTYDVSYADFIEGSAKSPTKENILPKIRRVLEKHKHLWQVGLMLGTQLAWNNYKIYLEQLLQNSDFIIGYGIDSLAVVLYSADTNRILTLSEKYNCIPTGGGFKISNLNIQGEIQPKTIITYNNEPVEGIHIIGPIRYHHRHCYEYASFYEDYYQNGKRFRLSDLNMKSFSIAGISQFSESQTAGKQSTKLRLCELHSENKPTLTYEDGDVLFTVGAESKIVLKNINEDSVSISILVAHAPIGYTLPKVISIHSSRRNMHVTNYNVWAYNITLLPNEEMVLYSNDLDTTHTRVTWRLNQLQLV